MRNVGRNDPCPCGSGKKSKHCCGTPAITQAPINTSGRVQASQLLERAVLHHRGGQFSQAEALYQQVLLIDPDQSDALHLLGVIAAQAGKFAQSAQLIERAIRKNPRNPVFHNNLGNAYRQIDQDTARCIACYRAAIRLDPQYAEAHNNLGNALKRKGDLPAALSSYQNALRFNSALLEAALGQGTVLQKLGRAEQAEATFRQLIGSRPDCSEAFIGLGTAQFALAKLSEAEASLLQALRLDRHSAIAYYNLGLVLNARGRPEPAAESLSTAIKLKPDYAEAYYHLGLALQANNLHPVAEQALLKALELDPENSLVLLSLAESKNSQGDGDGAVEICQGVIARYPKMGSAHFSLGMHLNRKGKLDSALESFQKALDLGVKSPTLLHMMAALRGEIPKTSAAEYVTEVFDGYAAKFDKHLIEGLKYDNPAHLLQMARKHCRTAEGAWRVLDLGCGTGLCGVAFAPFSEELAGVDLSGKMLDKARERNIYQRLVQSDLLGMMQAEPDARFDLLIAADVFVYIGDLEEIYAQARRLLVPGGLFLFSVESSDALLPAGQQSIISDYQLLLSGRFAHASAYLQRLATDHHLQLLALEERVLRMESNAPIKGWCVVLAA
ncbi:tetratricopeptide repeat protein [Pseudomonas sp. N040]|uniref:tetratricopeptide repeat protein n=1 Tax=Pseudomonas sp. N040 TaxID=2785325 RepID=UPI0018A2FD90|nr:tetratricopeptide repeat protein [Pseudomonas sp. N040]MBF7729757.1 tetratricopeptide repeat protein [Pseudomonas sp. N040]MBW7013399.1 tetratricopeptide repeat protein [Pseudomonas sp. N040]